VALVCNWKLTMALSKTGTLTLVVLLFAIVSTVTCQTGATTAVTVTGSLPTSMTSATGTTSNLTIATSTTTVKGAGGNASVLTSSAALAALTFLLSLVNLH